MKLIKYQMLQTTIIDEIELPKSEEYMSSITIPYSIENEELAKREAYKGEYEIFDNGIEPIVESTPQEDTDAMLVDHEYRLTILELFSDMTI
jgi:hypothetical protein